MKQQIKPAQAAVIVVIAAALIGALMYKLNFGGPPPAPPIPMAVSGGDAKPVATKEQMGAVVPASKEASSGAPTPGAGMMSPSLPGGGGPATPGGAGGPSLPGGGAIHFPGAPPR